MAHVNPGQVDTFMEWTGHAVDHHQAAQILRISNNDLETAVAKFFGTEGDPLKLKNLLEESKSTWDSSAFAADRYGDGGNSNLPTFNIEHAPGVDNYPHSGGVSAAPTRPSSRTSQRSAVPPLVGETPQQSIEVGQESGVTGGSRPVFGPATKPHYETDSWAMVPATSSIEYIPDAALYYQSRNEDTPAFVKPTPAGDGLPALLTILHTIPMFRNALLAPHLTADDYALNQDWWKGDAAAGSQTVDLTSASIPTNELDLIHQTQRLMAFLDSTTRSYVTLDSLFALNAWTKFRMSPEEPHDLDDDLLKYLLRWSFAFQKYTPDAPLDGMLRSTLVVGGEPQHSFVLDATVFPHEQGDQTLYDVFDAALFESDQRKAHISNTSDVLVLRLTSSNDAASVSCTIPGVLYADRYLHANKEQVDDVFNARRSCQEEMSKIDSEAQTLTTHKPGKAKHTRNMETLTLLKTSMRAFQPQRDEGHDNPDHAAVLAQLEVVCDRVESKLASLGEEKIRIQAALDSIDARFRAPLDPNHVSQSEPSSHKFEYPYHLRGVATSPTDYYVLHPDSSLSKHAHMQWWHINYSYNNDTATINRERTTLSAVLEDCGKEIRKMILVYANDEAILTPPVPLPEALALLVQRDNDSFLEDFHKQEQEWQNSTHDDTQEMIDWTERDPLDDNEGWHIDTTEHGQNANSGLSSTTLTPNTEVEEAAKPLEMQEINNGISSWTSGVSSKASSDTLEYDHMDLTGDPQRPAMTDVDLDRGNVQHIETFEKKAG